MSGIRMFVDEGLGHPSYVIDHTFVEQLLAGFGTFPTYFARLPELNRSAPRHYKHLPSAMTAAGILTGHGHRDATVLDGGPGSWTAVAARALEVSR